jgi:hypothetical protein
MAQSAGDTGLKGRRVRTGREHVRVVIGLQDQAGAPAKERRKVGRHVADVTCDTVALSAGRVRDAHRDRLGGIVERGASVHGKASHTHGTPHREWECLDLVEFVSESVQRALRGHERASQGGRQGAGAA